MSGALPQWFAPPRMIGGYVAGPELIARTGGTVVALRQMLAYPTGVEVEVEAYARGPYPPGAAPADGTSESFGRESLRFRLRFADGRELIQDDDSGLRGGQGPMLTVSGGEHSSGGPDNSEHARVRLWIWPLPPGGTVTLACSWPSRGLADATIALDGDAMRSAAERAEWYWPEEA
jgi:hypothetical protein